MRCCVTSAVSFCHHHKRKNANKSSSGRSSFLRAHRIVLVVLTSILFWTPPLVVSSSTTTTTPQAYYYRFADYYNSDDDDDDDDSEETTTDRQPPQQSLLADVAPPVVCEDEDVSSSWKRTDWYLATFWPAHAGFDNAHLQDGDDDDDGSSSSAAALTYGEVTPLGGRQLAYEMGIATSECGGGEDDPDDDKDNTTSSSSSILFYDLGSGTGRLVAQMYLDHPSQRVQKSVGIELAYDRHRIAQTAWEEGISQHSYFYDQEEDDACSSSSTDTTTSQDDKNVQKKDTSSTMMSCDITSFPIGSSLSSDTIPPPPPIQYIHGDALEILEWKEEATHIFLSSLCFPTPVLQALQGHLLECGPQLERVAALNRLDQLFVLVEEWDERTIPIQMSWGPSTAKIYQRKRRR